MKGEGLTETEVLQQARVVLEMGWAQRASARNAKGIPCEWDEAAACSWCATGALLRVASMFAPAHTQALATLKTVVGYSIVAWNDTWYRTKAEVLSAFDQAIELSLDKARGSAKVD